MSKEKELLEKIEGVLSIFSKIQIVAGVAPVIGKVVETLAEAALYFRGLLQQLEDKSDPVVELTEEDKKEVENV